MIQLLTTVYDINRQAINVELSLINYNKKRLLTERKLNEIFQLNGEFLNVNELLTLLKVIPIDRYSTRKHTTKISLDYKHCKSHTLKQLRILEELNLVCRTFGGNQMYYYLTEKGRNLMQGVE